VHHAHAVGGIDDRLVFVVPADAVARVTLSAEKLDDLSATSRLSVNPAHFDAVPDAHIAALLRGHEFAPFSSSAMLSSDAIAAKYDGRRVPATVTHVAYRYISRRYIVRGMAELTSTAKAILGMVYLGKRTGYEIKQLVDKSSRFFWAASYGQIYPELKRLEEQGLLEARDDPRGGRNRREYSLTPTGEQAFRAWLASGEDFVLEQRNEGLLKLFFADALSPNEVQALLHQKIEQHERILERLCQIAPEERPAENDFPLLVRDYGIAFNEWAAQWYRELAERLARRR
jgi:PadR family transcriptional regulator, regulatory protein AphA